MKYEKELKYTLSEKIFLILKEKSIKKIQIAQWYMNDNTRLRLELYNGNKKWLKTSKKRINNLLREESEEEVHPDKIDSEDLKNHSVVLKYRYIISYEPEIITDEIINLSGRIIYNTDYQKIKYLLEIEEKSNPIENLEKYLFNYLKNLYNINSKELNPVYNDFRFNNSYFAGKGIYDTDKILKGEF
ncbi:MAG TPA: hypothetical protein PLS66_07230 [Tepiditoga sp.]|nr:hypothetical protein [Tepiditoga sp.]